ncbi:MAG TPA: VanZ family protein [Gemmatimonadaceae bacterium]|nr:VanZ family protein [Gemmatimonadaceae bacterium]
MPPRFLYPLLPYRSFLVPILVLSAIVVPIWVAVRLYRHRTRRQSLSLPRELLLLAFVVYLSAVAAATLTPNRSERLVAEGRGAVVLRPSLTSLTCASASLPAGSTARAFCVHNARGNVMLFFPLGILLPLVWPRLRFWRGMQIALALSVSIELLQYLSSALGSYRSADVNDVILNVVGAGLGLALMSVLRWRPGARPEVVRA